MYIQLCVKQSALSPTSRLSFLIPYRLALTICAAIILLVVQKVQAQEIFNHADSETSGPHAPQTFVKTQNLLTDNLTNTKLLFGTYDISSVINFKDFGVSPWKVDAAFIAIEAEGTPLLTLVPNGFPLEKRSTISSEYGMRFHPSLKRHRHHKGIDFSVPTGSLTLSTAPGVVRVADNIDNSAYGRYVVIDHALGFTSVYAHLQDIKVKVGDQVEKGSILGRSGNSGRSTGPHLHYEIHYHGVALDPKYFTNWSTETYRDIFNKVNSVPWLHLAKRS